jgi:hypothetical protein
MRYYVAADVHGFYTEFHKALEEAGYFADPGPKKLVILGDLFDRGREALEMQDFILKLLAEDALVLVRGNHEDLFVRLVNEDLGLPVRPHVGNGTYGTALQLTGWGAKTARVRHLKFAAKARETPYYRQIIPAAVDYFETARYLFVHGWIPGVPGLGKVYRYDPDWRAAEGEDWKKARWINGMDAAQSCREEKTILCGHFHCSYGHAVYEKKGSEFGPDADFSPYYAPGVIALDACTALSGRVNVLVLEDEPLAE